MYNTVQYFAIEYNVAQCNTAQYCTILYCTIQYCTVLYSTLYSAVLHNTVRHCKSLPRAKCVNLTKSLSRAKRGQTFIISINKLLIRDDSRPDGFFGGERLRWADLADDSLGRGIHLCSTNVHLFFPWTCIYFPWTCICFSWT